MVKRKNVGRMRAGGRGRVSLRRPNRRPRDQQSDFFYGFSIFVCEPSGSPQRYQRRGKRTACDLMGINVKGEQLLTLEAAAKRLEVNEKTLKRWMRTGIRGIRLERLRIGRRTYTTAEAI